jgi:cephalosporin hydroxylase
LVAEGCYLVVADTIINGHPAVPHWGPGPMEAVDAFLAEGAPFTPDERRERLLITFSPRGFLRRV